MNASDWDRIDDAFQAALEVPPAERQALLDRLCEGRDDLRREVESLLEAHGASTSFLQPLAALPLADPEVPVGVGSVVGAYRLVEAIGHGGMGTVFLAERTDGAFTHRVAVKVMRAALADRDAVRRFQAERQILASLSHPHIVTLVDGGTTPGGQPYLAMEHVEGQPIVPWLQERRASLEDRLRLFRQVCSAVHFAHRHGIVHRDLKPANILVTREGVPKVLDFGVAKLLDQPGPEATATRLLPGPLTPNYASPEQLRGLAVTTASDVYSLGVLLFEVLAGTRPYETTGRPVDEVLRQVLHGPSVRPSAVAARHEADPRAAPLPYAAKRLRGDLDAIVLKAMHVDPAERYSSAEELSDDVARWLGGKPVLAREPSLAYVVRKLAQRHRTATAAIALAVMGVLVALGVALWQRQVAVQERALAEQRFDDVRGLTTALIFKLHDAVAPLHGSTEVRRLIVAQALGYLERLAASSQREDVRFDLALAYQRIGRAQGDPQTPNLGEREAALASFRRALELLSSLRESPALGTKALFETSQTNRLIAQVLSVMGRQDEAIAASHEALAMARAALQRDPDNEELLRLVASGHFAVALAERDRAVKIRHWLAAEPIFEALLARKPDDVDRMRNVALVNKYLGGHLQLDGKDSEAERRYRRALELDERRAAADPANRLVQFDLAIDLANVGSVLARKNQDVEALRFYERSVAMRERLVASDPNDVLARRSLAGILISVARVRFSVDDWNGAARDAERALELARGLPAAEKNVARKISAQAELSLARVDVEQGRQAAACERHRRAFELTDRRALVESDASDRYHVKTLESKLTRCASVAAEAAAR
jgi:non-specific serine/threonine protein kinase/serine/threonine-protein kinase